MDNASIRLLKIIKNSGKNTISQLVGLTVLQTSPLQLTDGDKLILTREFIIFNSMIRTDRLSVGDKLLAITLNDGQMYYIVDVVNSTLELNKYKLLIDDLQTQINGLKTRMTSAENNISSLNSRVTALENRL